MNKIVCKLIFGVVALVISIALLLNFAYAQEGYNISLKAGENLVTLPLGAPSINIQDFLSPIIDKVKDAWEYNPIDSGNAWKHYKPGLEDYSDLIEMSSGAAYWINLKYDATLQISGTDVGENALVEFKQGWNIINWPYEYSQDITQALCGMVFGTDYIQVSKYNNATKNQENFLNQPESDDFTAFSPGETYYIYMLTNKIIRIGVPFESWSNDDFESAFMLGIDSPINGTINPSGDKDYYEVNVNTLGNVTVSLTDVPAEIKAKIEVYDSAQNLLVSKDNRYYAGKDLIFECELPTKGVYFIVVSDYLNKTSINPYTLNVSFSACFDDIYEPNNNFVEASEINLGETTHAPLFTSGDKDYYKINVDTWGKITISMTSVPSNIRAKIDIYDSAKNLLISKDNLYYAGKDLIFEYLLQYEGEYYIVVSDVMNNSSTSAYSLRFDFLPAYNDTFEPNNSFDESAVINLGGNINATIFNKGDIDYYKFHISEQEGMLKIELTNVPAETNVYLQIYKSDRTILTYNVGQTGKDIKFLYLLTAGAGDYYISLYDISNDASSFSPYNLKLEFTNIWIQNVSDSPDPFSPNNDTVKDTTTIKAVVSKESNWMLLIKDESGILKRSYNGTGTIIQEIWDGKDSSGKVVTDGSYTYTIEAVSISDGAIAFPVSDTVSVDNTLPQAEITEPGLGETITGVITIKGTADDLNYSSIQMYYGIGVSPSKWYYIYNIKKTGSTFEVNLNTSGFVNGEYTLKLIINDNAGNSSTVTRLISTYNITIYTYSDSPDPFSPNSDDTKDTTTIKADITAACNWVINIKDSAGVIRRTYQGSGQTVQQDWDGKDSDGITVGDGIYTYSINAYDPVSETSSPQVSGTVTIDNTPPQAEITYPAGEAVLKGTVTITGIADDLNYNSTNVFYGSGRLPSYWTYITYVNRTGADFTVDWKTTSLSNGEYTIKLKVEDKAGNSSIVTLPVSVYNVNIYSFSDRPDPFSPNFDGRKDTTAINASITTESNWTISIKNSSGIIKRTYQGTGRTIQQEWDGKDSLGVVVPAGRYTYTIDAYDPVSKANAPQVSGTITIDNTFPRAEITEPEPGERLSGIIEIKGIADDSDYYSGAVYYGEGISPVSNWIRISFVSQSDSFAVTWDTRRLTDGDYTIYLVVSDKAGNESIAEQIVNIFNVSIDSYYVSPYIFSPNNDNVSDVTTINGVSDVPVNWTVAVKDINGLIQRTWNDTGTSVQKVWDGKDSTGLVVPDGTYTYVIEAVDSVSGTTAIPVSGIVAVDNTPPQLAVSEPVSNASLSGIIQVIGIADDNNYSSGRLYYGLGFSPDSWQEVSVFNKAVPKKGVLSEWNTAILSNGDYTLKIKVTDKAENSSEILMPVNIYNVNSYNVSDSPDPFSPNGDGQEDSTLISASFTGTFDWTIQITNTSGTLIRDFSGNGRNVYQIWDGKDSTGNIAADGTYTYLIGVFDSVTSTQSLQSSGTIDVDTTPPQVCITSPQPNEVVYGTYNIKGIVDDRHFASSTGSGLKSMIYIGWGTSPTGWIPLYNIPRPVQQEFIIICRWITTNLGSGYYTLRVVAVDHAENTTEVNVPIILCKQDDFYITANPFSPNGDGIKDTTAVIGAFSQEINWTISVKDTADTLVRTFTGTGYSFKQIWDGLNGSGQRVNDGVYTFFISASDTETGGEVFTRAMGIVVDTTAPVIDITQPVNAEQVSGKTKIRGTAEDPNFDYHNSYLEYCNKQSPDDCYTIAKITPVSIESVLAEWDTRCLVNGTYLLRLITADTAGNTAQNEVWVNTYNVKIINASVSPESFSPNGDGNMDTATFSAEFSMNLDWQMDILAFDTNTLVKSFSGKGNSLSQVWDGRDSGGTILADNVFYADLRVTDSANSSNTDQFFIQVSIDTEAPVCEIVSPVNEQVVFGTVPIIGTASDINFVDYSVEYGKGDNPVSWQKVDSSSQGVVNDVLADWDTSSLDNGEYTIRLLVDDVTGNTAVDSVTVGLDNTKISGVVIEPSSFNPSDGETVNICYTLDRAADITVKVYDLDNTLVKTLVDSLLRQTGQHIEVWDGKDDADNIVSAGGYTITIDADEGKGWYQSSYGFINNWEAVLNFTNSERFNPYNNESCRISFTLAQDSIFSIRVGQDENRQTNRYIIDSKVLPAGSHTYYWDGRDRNGKILDYYTETYSLVIAYDSLNLPDNTIVVVGNVTEDIELISNPYAIVASFGEFTTINYKIPYDGEVTVSIYKPLDTLVTKLLDNQFQSAGEYSLTWDGKDSSGKVVAEAADYIIKVELKSGGQTITKTGNITVDFVSRKKKDPF